MDKAKDTKAAAGKICPRCNQPSQVFTPVDTGMKLRLEEAGITDKYPPEVCQRCYTEISSQLSQGARIRAEEMAKAQNKMLLWKSRVNLVRDAKTAMAKKNYSDAALLYEKYLKVLEMVYEIKPGELSPEVFNGSSRSKEMTIVTSVYFDLFRIYDSSQRFVDRQRATAKKLIEFATKSSIHREILRSMEAFYAVGKNNNLIKDCIKDLKKGDAGCFIASATFCSSEAHEVLLLRSFRDQILMNSLSGQVAIRIYYLASPPIAEFIEKYPSTRLILRPLIRRIAMGLSSRFNLQSHRPS